MTNERCELIERPVQARNELNEAHSVESPDQAGACDGLTRRDFEAVLREYFVPDSFLNHTAIELTAAALLPGTILGPYEILGQLGAGGMGQVYRARDTRLRRNVAIKALPLEFAHD